MNPFAQTLTANRTRFNARFAEARHFKPKLDGESFGNLLRALVAPIVEAVHQTHPEQTYAVTEALYDIALDLLGQELLGPHSRYPVIASGWTHLLPKLARHLAADPRAVIGAVTNALYNLAATPGARPGAWMNDLLALADMGEDASTLLKAGQICAWRAGLAHYRAAALDLCQTLPPRLARLTLGLPDNESQPLDSIITRLRADPWWQLLSNSQPLDAAPPSGTSQGKSFDYPTTRLPDHSTTPNPQLHIVKRVGAFRGFGGLFLVPPIVESAGEHFLVTDGEETWLLTADAFGATFHRAEDQPTAAKINAPFTLNRAGEVTAGGDKQLFSELAQSTSHAANHTTLAVTVPYSHAVYLVALAREQ